MLPGPALQPKVAEHDGSQQKRHHQGGQGRAFTQGGKYDLAVEQLTAAKSEVQLMNDLKKDIIYSLGDTYEKMGKAKEAVEYQRRKFKFSRRLAALTLGIQRVADAKQSRGLFP